MIKSEMAEMEMKIRRTRCQLHAISTAVAGMLYLLLRLYFRPLSALRIDIEEIHVRDDDYLVFCGIKLDLHKLFKHAILITISHTLSIVQNNRD